VQKKAATRRRARTAERRKKAPASLPTWWPAWEGPSRVAWRIPHADEPSPRGRNPGKTPRPPGRPSTFQSRLGKLHSTYKKNGGHARRLNWRYIQVRQILKSKGARLRLRELVSFSIRSANLSGRASEYASKNSKDIAAILRRHLVALHGPAFLPSPGTARTISGLRTLLKQEPVRRWRALKTLPASLRAEHSDYKTFEQWRLEMLLRELEGRERVERDGKELGEDERLPDLRASRLERTHRDVVKLSQQRLPPRLISALFRGLRALECELLGTRPRTGRVSPQNAKKILQRVRSQRSS
jgi:hypothetical protein